MIKQIGRWKELLLTLSDEYAILEKTVSEIIFIRGGWQ